MFQPRFGGAMKWWKNSSTSVQFRCAFMVSFGSSSAATLIRVESVCRYTKECEPWMSPPHKVKQNQNKKSSAQKDDSVSRILLLRFWSGWTLSAVPGTCNSCCRHVGCCCCCCCCCCCIPEDRTRRRDETLEFPPPDADSSATLLFITHSSLRTCEMYGE